MLRAALLAAALFTLGAAKPETVDYRLAFEAPGGAPMLDVEVRLRGDADGQTDLLVPQGLASDLAVSGASVQTPDAAHRRLSHRPGAKLTIRYRVRGARDGLSALGEQVFVQPDGRAAQPATVRWGKLPAGWRMASDLEHAAPGRPLTVGAVVQSVILAGSNLQVGQAPLAGGELRAAQLGGDAAAVQRLAGAAASVIAAERTFWGDEDGPFLAARTEAADHPVDRGDGVAVPTIGLSDAALPAAIAEAHLRTWIPARLGRAPAANAAPSFTDGLTGFLANRILLRAGLTKIDTAVGRLAEADRSRDAVSRGMLLALKWDEDVRRKTAGKADLDDVVLQMRNHFRRFPPGQEPDLVTGLVSAAWVTAGLDLRPDLARYADASRPIELPEEMFDGCLQARVTVAPAFDAGFNADASFAAKRLIGVRPRGPAWNSGLRDGMPLTAWTYRPGDMTRQIELTVLPARGKAAARARPRKIVYWPYGDADTTTRKLQLQPVLAPDQLTACARKLAGL